MQRSAVRAGWIWRFSAGGAGLGIGLAWLLLRLWTAAARRHGHLVWRLPFIEPASRQLGGSATAAVGFPASACL